MTKVLIVIDPREKTHSALERCKQLSPTDDLQFHVCMFVEYDTASELGHTLKDRTAWLEDQVKPYEELGYNIEYEVTSFYRLHESIIKVALACAADIIFKPMRQHSLVRRVMLTSTDWNLIRFCPTPVLLVSDNEVAHGQPIIAAVDVCSEDSNHEALNKVVLEEAAAVAQVMESEVTFVHSWNMSSAVMAAGSIDPTPYEIAQGKREDHLNESLALASNYGIPAERVIVEEGTAEFVINNAAKDIGAGLIVIGTVARSGMSGLFVGNTAEAVLEGSSVDVLVVKEAGFECPLDL